jgi:hypothetical protein
MQSNPNFAGAADQRHDRDRATGEQSAFAPVQIANGLIEGGAACD